MTPEPKPDWADAMAREAIADLWHHDNQGYGGNCYTEDYPDELAQLLREVARKNKAEGMRLGGKASIGLRNFSTADFLAQIDYMADKIEKGEA